MFVCVCVYVLFEDDEDCRWSNPAAVEPSLVDERISQKLPHVSLRFYDGISHRGIFNVPKYVREEMKRETRVMTKDNPVFIY